MKNSFFALVTSNGLKFEDSAKFWFESLGNVKEGDQIEFVVSKVSKKNYHVLQQRRYIFGVVYVYIGFHCGYTIDETHQVMASEYLSYDKTGRSGIVQKFIQSISNNKIDTVKMTGYIDNCIGCAKGFGVSIPTPDQVSESPEIQDEIRRMRGAMKIYAQFEEVREFLSRSFLLYLQNTMTHEEIESILLN